MAPYVTISGFGFAGVLSENDVTISIGPYPCSVFLGSLSHVSSSVDRVTCIAPTGVTSYGVQYPLSLTIIGTVTTTSTNVSFVFVPAPEINSIVPAGGMPGSLFTIVGSSLVTTLPLSAISAYTAACSSGRGIR